MDPNAPQTPDRRKGERQDSKESSLVASEAADQGQVSKASSSDASNSGNSGNSGGEPVVRSNSTSGLSPSMLMSELVDRAGSGWYQIMVLVPLLGVTMQEYSQVQVMNSISTALQLEFGLTRREKALLPSLSFLGLALGTFFSGFLADTIGRRKAVLMGFCTTSCTILLVSHASSYLQMVMLAVLNGVASGCGVAAAMAHIAEICPKEVRPVIFVFPMFAQVLGEVYSTMVMSVFLPDLEHGPWRVVVLVVGVPSFLLALLCYLLLDESPLWLIVQGQHEKARETIVKVAWLNGRLRDVEELSRGLLEEGPVIEGTNMKAQPNNIWSAVSDASKSMRFLVVAVSCAYLCFVGQLLTFGSGYLWPEILQSPYYAGAHVAPAVGLSLIRSFGVPSAIFMLPVMRSSLGHRWIIAISVVSEVMILNVCIVAMTETLVNGTGLGDWIIIMAGVSLTCANFMYTTVCLFLTESFPTSLRAVMVASCVSVGRVGALLGPELVESYGFTGFMAFAAGCCCLALLFLLTLKETKGMGLPDESMFKVKSRPGEESEHWFEWVKSWLLPQASEDRAQEQEQLRREVSDRYPLRASPKAKAGRQSLRSAPSA